MNSFEDKIAIVTSGGTGMGRELTRQLAQAGYDDPRSGWRIEGAFLFTGRVAGGIPR